MENLVFLPSSLISPSCLHFLKGSMCLGMLRCHCIGGGALWSLVVIFPCWRLLCWLASLATRWYRSQLYICVPKQGPLPSTPLCKGVVEDLGTQETLGYLSRPRVGSSSCCHRLEIVLTSWPPFQVPPKRGSSFVESPNLTRGCLVSQLPCLTMGRVTRFLFLAPNLLISRVMFLGRRPSQRCCMFTMYHS